MFLNTVVTPQGLQESIEPNEVSGSLPHDPQAGDPFADFVHQMQAALSQPIYEYDGPFPIGGPDGTYPLRNRWETPGEWAVAAVTFLGAGTAQVTPDAAPVAVPGNAAVLNGDTFATQRGLVFSASAATTIPLPLVWSPLEAFGQISMVVSASGKSVFAHIYTRRRVLPGGAPAQAIR